MKVTTKDFQILQGEHTFEFPIGITVLQGKTGSGKTTVFYAINDCLVNPNGVDDVINWDAKQCSVTIENNDNKITWIKTPTSSIYRNEITGQEFVKASKLDSTDLGDLGFYIKDDEVINIQGEWNLLFPFALKDTEMFRLFEDIFNISCSFAIIDQYKKEEQSIKSNINQTTSQINDLTQNINKIDEILNNVDATKVDTFITTINKNKQLVSQIQNDFNNLSKNYNYKNIKVPKMYDTGNMVNVGNYYMSISTDYNNYLVNHNLNNLQLPEIKQFDLKEPQIQTDYKNYCYFTNEITKNKETLLQLTEQLEQCKQQLSQIKVCPTCGRPLEEE